MPITSTTESSWRTIIPGDASTLPTGRDCNMFGRVRWRLADGHIEDQPPSFFEPGENNPVAWTPIPPYTPPEPVKRVRREWYLSQYEYYDDRNYRCREVRADSSDPLPAENERILAREVLPDDMDPDAAIRLRDVAMKDADRLELHAQHLQAHGFEHVAHEFDLMAAELREAAK